MLGSRLPSTWLQYESWTTRPRHCVTALGLSGSWRAGHGYCLASLQGVVERHPLVGGTDSHTSSLQESISADDITGTVWLQWRLLQVSAARYIPSWYCYACATVTTVLAYRMSLLAVTSWGFLLLNIYLLLRYCSFGSPLCCNMTYRPPGYV